MSFLLDIPERLPLLTAPEHVLFPQAMMPLFVINPAHMKMLHSCLNQDRLLVFACSSDPYDDHCHRHPSMDLLLETATVALIRACYRPTPNEALVILQGLGRVHLKKVSQNRAFPVALIEPLKTSLDATPRQLRTLRNKLLLLLKQKANPGKKILSILESVSNPLVFLDLAAFSVCRDTHIQMQLLETLSDKKRFELLIEYLNTAEFHSSKLSRLNSFEKSPPRE